MGLTEGLFHQLIEKTEDLLQVFKSPDKTESLNESDYLFAEREILLKQLSEELQQISNIDEYKSLYVCWQEKESRLQLLIQTSLQELEKKIAETQNAKTITKQYDSYLRQMPYGAFLDKKS